ncbi:anaerobic ribonucleoside-triphosphate reductase activating protein [Arcobacter sp. FWKO B]|nr:anaerobic ribonucleoside-triphosphate reductase activating protein [Arcobacter sp. FWKO B]
MSKKKRVYNITPFTLLDYPAKSACIVWFSGCGMRCGYCYNTEIVTSDGNYSYFEVLSFLYKRQGLLQGVVLCGGEPLFSYDEYMLEFIKKIKEMGFLVKLDTNGVNFKGLKELIDLNLLDYVALDFKSTKEKFNLVTQNPNFYYEYVLNSINLLIESKIEFEIRTTVHDNLLNIDDITNMIKTLENLYFKGSYFIQNFLESKTNFANLQKSYNQIDTNLLTSDKFKIKFRNYL